jgi:hypothetical protein
VREVKGAPPSWFVHEIFRTGKKKKTDDEDDDEEGRVVEDTQVVRRFVMQLGIAIAVRQGLFINESGWLSTGSIQTTVYAKCFA